MKLRLINYGVVFILSIVYLNAQAFWGMTNQGGDNGDGVIFKTDANGENYTVIRSMGNEQRTLGSLMQASNGKLYGMSNGGGNPAIDKGTIFEIDLSSEMYTELAYFNCLFGCEPIGTLIEASNGLFYGMTSNGTTPSDGWLFVFDASTNVITGLVNFNGDNGSSPTTNTLVEVDGNIYGVTNKGGENNAGVLFKYNIANDTYEVKYDFNDIGFSFSHETGVRPIAGLIKASNGLLYGTTQLGGIDNAGVLFSYNPITETYTKLFNFEGALNTGMRPEGDLLEVSPGILYGTTSIGGLNGSGVIFKYNIISNLYTKVIDFERQNNNMTGKNPASKLMLAANGNLYGMAARGGPFITNQAPGRGTIFEFNLITNELILKHGFEESTGQYPTFTHLLEAFPLQNCAGGIDEVIDLTNRSIMTDTTANLSIISNGSVIMGNDVKFYAGESIELVNDFEVENNAIFHAYIETCQ